MTQITLNADQFRELVAGKAVSVGCCEIRLGDVGFDLFEVDRVNTMRLPFNPGLHVIKTQK
jgi:hypothetical protein